MLDIFLDCVPPTATAQQKGIRIIIPASKAAAASIAAKKGGAHAALRYAIPAHFEKKPLKEARDLFSRLLLPHVPEKPLEGPLAVEADWTFPWRKSESKKTILNHDRLPKDTAPDAGNLNKLLIDVMTQLGFWNDDGQIFDERARKWWGAKPGIGIRILNDPWALATETTLNLEDNPPGPADDLPFDSAEFRETWEQFKEVRRKELRKKMTPTAEKRALKKLAKLTEAQAIATIELSLDNGWQGLFPERVTKAPPHSRPPLAGGNPFTPAPHPSTRIV